MYIVFPSLGYKPSTLQYHYILSDSALNLLLSVPGISSYFLPSVLTRSARHASPETFTTSYIISGNSPHQQNSSLLPNVFINLPITIAYVSLIFFCELISQNISLCSIRYETVFLLYSSVFQMVAFCLKFQPAKLFGEQNKWQSIPNEPLRICG